MMVDVVLTDTKKIAVGCWGSEAIEMVISTAGDVSIVFRFTGSEAVELGVALQRKGEEQLREAAGAQRV